MGPNRTHATPFVQPSARQPSRHKAVTAIAASDARALARMPRQPTHGMRSATRKQALQQEPWHFMHMRTLSEDRKSLVGHAVCNAAVGHVKAHRSCEHERSLLLSATSEHIVGGALRNVLGSCGAARDAHRWCGWMDGWMDA